MPLPALDYIDLHCDTAYELYHQSQHIRSNSLTISLERTSSFSRYAQFFAVWSDRARSDEQAYLDFLAITDYFSEQLQAPETQSRIRLVRCAQEFKSAWDEGKQAAFLAVEDARLLAGDLNRLEQIYTRGVTYLTLLWGGKSCIGGSHDTDQGPTTSPTERSL